MTDDDAAIEAMVVALVDRYDLIEMGDGTLMRVHRLGNCFGQFCCIHKPSDHPLANAPMIWNEKYRVMLRLCPHQELHPDPDSWLYRNASYLLGIHDGPPPPWHACCDEKCCSRDILADI